MARARAGAAAGVAAPGGVAGVVGVTRGVAVGVGVGGGGEGGVEVTTGGDFATTGADGGVDFGMGVGAGGRGGGGAADPIAGDRLGLGTKFTGGDWKLRSRSQEWFPPSRQVHLHQERGSGQPIRSFARTGGLKSSMADGGRHQARGSDPACQLAHMPDLLQSVLTQNLKGWP